MEGLEPPLREEHDPKSCASASSATSAVYFPMGYKLVYNYSNSLSNTFTQFIHYFRMSILV